MDVGIDMNPTPGMPIMPQPWPRTLGCVRLRSTRLSQVVTFPQGAGPARRLFADAFLARSQAALDDLDALGAVREALPSV